jgi:hypothetical protein
LRPLGVVALPFEHGVRECVLVNTRDVAAEGISNATAAEGISTAAEGISTAAAEGTGWRRWWRPGEGVASTASAATEGGGRPGEGVASTAAWWGRT